MALALLHGPFNCNAGLHQQDEPTGRRIKVAKVESGFLTDSAGRRHEIVANGSRVLSEDGGKLTAYRKGVKVSPLSLSEGDEVELAAQRTYGPAWTPPSLKREGVSYEPFKSSSNLIDPKLRHNRPNAIKFSLATEQAQGDEIAELRRQNEELRLQLSQRGPAEMDGEHVVGDPKAAGQRMSENADKREATKNQPAQQGKQGDKKLVP